MRRFVTLCLILCMAVSAPVAVLAQPAGRGVVAESSEYVPYPASGSAVQAYSPAASGNVKLKSGSFVRYIDRVELPDYAVALYETLAEGADGDGAADLLIDVTQAQKNGDQYVIPLTQFTGSYSDNAELEKAIQANFSEARTNALAAIAAFDRDHPEVFWLTGSWSTSYTYSGNGKTYTQDVYLILSDAANGVDVRLDRYTDPATLRAAIAARDSYVQSILNGMPSTAVTPVGKMRYFNEWLTHNNEYNTANLTGNDSAASALAWECISALQGSTGVNGPVCEGYARAFQVLCNRSGIPCVLVSGDTLDINTGVKSGHMWNYVQVDGGWYAVDVAWNDPGGSNFGKKSGYERENYLFLGADSVPVTGSGTFLVTHPAENSVFAGGVRFTNGPVLSKNAYGDHIHTYGAPTFRWSADGKHATATFTCADDPSHKTELTANVTRAVKTAATCESMGSSTYTASVSMNGKEYISTKDLRDIPALGHDWGDWVQTKAPTEAEQGEDTRTCRHYPGHTETRESSASGGHAHTLTPVPGKEPTETEAGMKPYYICSGCGDWFLDETGTVEIVDKNNSALLLLAAGPLGDIDGNGRVDAIDYMLLKRYVLGSYTLTGKQIAAANMSHGNAIGAIDYMLLKRYVLGSYALD